jgi:hypothetical protein
LAAVWAVATAVLWVARTAGRTVACWAVDWADCWVVCWAVCWAVDWAVCLAAGWVDVSVDNSAVGRAERMVVSLVSQTVSVLGSLLVSQLAMLLELA